MKRLKSEDRIETYTCFLDAFKFILQCRHCLLVKTLHEVFVDFDHALTCFG